MGVTHTKKENTLFSLLLLLIFPLSRNILLCWRKPFPQHYVAVFLFHCDVVFYGWYGVSVFHAMRFSRHACYLCSFYYLWQHSNCRSLLTMAFFSALFAKNRMCFVLTKFESGIELFPRYFFPSTFFFLPFASSAGFHCLIKHWFDQAEKKRKMFCDGCASI